MSTQKQKTEKTPEKEGVKMVVCDLDGTLLSMKGTITERSKKAIRAIREKGILFVICSGRSAVALQDLVKHWGIENDVDYVLGFNGGMLFDPRTGKTEQWHLVDARNLPGVIKSFEGYPVAFGEYNGNRFQTTKSNFLTKQMSRRNKLDFDVCSPQDLIQDTSKFMAVGMPWTISKYLKNEKTPDGVRMFRSGPFLIEIIHPELSKLEGVKILAQRLGIDTEEVLSFGNDNNDLEMLEGTKGVAMANALDSVKKAAPYLTSSNRKDGVAEFLEKYVIPENASLPAAHQKS